MRFKVFKEEKFLKALLRLLRDSPVMFFDLEIGKLQRKNSL